MGDLFLLSKYLLLSAPIGDKLTLIYYNNAPRGVAPRLMIDNSLLTIGCVRLGTVK